MLFTLSPLAVAIAPSATTAFFGYLIHADLSALARRLTIGSFIGDLIRWTIAAGFTFALAGGIYNWWTGAGFVQHATGGRQTAA